jgi:hypothetical protein
MEAQCWGGLCFPDESNAGGWQYALLVNFNPTNATQLARSAQVQRRGERADLRPYGGKLDNSAKTSN